MTRTVDPILTELLEMTLRMGALAEAILDKACRVVRSRQPELYAEVERDDLEIDRLDVAIDDAILRALARQAPLAGDLRQVLAVKAMAVDLERIGDLARNIARSGARLAGRPPSPHLGRLGGLESQTRELVRNALDSFRDRDADAARAVIGADDAIDELQDEIVRDLIHEIEGDPSTAGGAVDLILIAESLERVADHATNIAEDVILVAEARNVKHAEKLGGVR